MAMPAFWLLEISTLIFILFAFEYLASGHLFPLDLLPSAVNHALFFTPPQNQRAPNKIVFALIKTYVRRMKRIFSLLLPVVAAFAFLTTTESYAQNTNRPRSRAARSALGCHT
jgi:hypothetical protein